MKPIAQCDAIATVIMKIFMSDRRLYGRIGPICGCHRAGYEFVEQSLTHDRRLEYSAIVAFARLINISILSQNEKIQKDFAYWMRFVRNCSLSRNLNQQIDNPEKERRVRKFLLENASPRR